MSDGVKSLPLAVLYFLAETGLDVAVLWILVTNGHPWWGMIYAIVAGFGANINVKRYMGVADD